MKLLNTSTIVKKRYWVARLQRIYSFMAHDRHLESSALFYCTLLAASIGFCRPSSLVVTRMMSRDLWPVTPWSPLNECNNGLLKGQYHRKKNQCMELIFFLLAFLIFLNQKNIVWGPNSVKNIATTFHFHDSFSWANHHYTSMAASLEACKITTELAQIIHYWRYAYAVVLLIELSLGRGSLRYCL